MMALTGTKICAVCGNEFKGSGNLCKDGYYCNDCEKKIRRVFQEDEEDYLSAADIRKKLNKYADAIADDDIAPYAFLDEEGYVPTSCTLFVKPGMVDYYFLKRGFYSEEYEMFFFADIQEMQDPDGISHMRGETAASPQFFTVDGRQQRSAKKGLNIIRLPEGRSLKRLFR